MNDYLSITKLATALGLRLKETRDRLLEAGLLQKGTNGFVPTERAQKYQPKLGRWRISLGPDVWDWNVAEVRKLIFVLEIDASTSQDASGVEAQDGKDSGARRTHPTPWCCVFPGEMSETPWCPFAGVRNPSLGGTKELPGTILMCPCLTRAFSPRGRSVISSFCSLRAG